MSSTVDVGGTQRHGLNTSLKAPSFNSLSLAIERPNHQASLHYTHPHSPSSNKVTSLARLTSNNHPERPSQHAFCNINSILLSSCVLHLSTPLRLGIHSNTLVSHLDCVRAASLHVRCPQLIPSRRHSVAVRARRSAGLDAGDSLCCPELQAPRSRWALAPEHNDRMLSKLCCRLQSDRRDLRFSRCCGSSKKSASLNSKSLDSSCFVHPSVQCCLGPHSSTRTHLFALSSLHIASTLTLTQR